MIIMQIEIKRNLVKGFRKEAVMRGPMNDPMTGLVIVIQGKRGSIIKIVRGLETGTKKEIVDVDVMIETSTGIMIRTRKDREHERSYDHHCSRGRDPDRDYEHSSYERDCGHFREKDADYGNQGPRHDRNLAEYEQHYGYSH